MSRSSKARWIEVKVPRLGANDEYALLVEWNAAPGDKISAGQSIAVIETSKAAQDLEAEVGGYLYPLVDAGLQVGVQDTIALILPRADSASVDRYRDQLSVKADMTPGGHSDVPLGVSLTKKALDIARQEGINLSMLPEGRIIRETDIRRLVAPQTVSRSVGIDPPANSGPAIILIGGGGLGRMCIDILRSMGDYSLTGVLDKNLTAGHDVLGVPVLGSDQEMAAYRKRGVMFACNAVGTITLPSPRVAVYERLKKQGFLLPNLIHPRAEISPSAILGDGCIIEANAFVGPAARIGSDCIINTNAVVAHDCCIGDHVHVAPSATLAGNVTVGDRSIIGMGVTIYMGVSIGHDVVVYDGQHVFHDIPDGRTVR